MLLWPHALAGTLALLVQVVPLLASKGGTLHRKVGWVFVVAMGLTSVSGTALGALGMRRPPGPPRRGSGSTSSTWGC